MSELRATLADLFERRGGAGYSLEPVTQAEHALQSALLGEAEGAPASLVTAAFLHDIGHMLSADGEAAAFKRGIDGLHEKIGGKWLARWFGPEVTEPIALHVDAKRYLCATEPGYFERLSPVSVRSLELQGGPFTPAEADEFIARPFATEAVRLRRWDERAKVEGLATPTVDRYLDIVETVIAKL